MYQKLKISIQDTNNFSSLVCDYISEDEKVKPFIADFPSLDAVKRQLNRKSVQSLNRNRLHEVILSQYQHLDRIQEVDDNINLLLQKSTYTICTAHQPSVFTGHLYFIYKTLHAIRLSQELNEEFADNHFVPIFYLGSEDADLDEIGELNLNGKKLHWNTKQKGSCGRMLTSEFDDLLAEVSSVLNIDIPSERKLLDLFKQAYDGTHTLSEATRIILHSLFGPYGLVVLDADDKRLKRQFVDVIQDELLNNRSHALVSDTIDALAKVYKVQAAPRELNLFYMHESIRERVESKNSTWKVVNTDLEFDQGQLLDEVKNYPERFSPNVILRPLYQEMILPNVVFIGGGGEIAYWLQLKNLFEHFQYPFPLLQLRNSVLWLPNKSIQKMEKLGVSTTDLFQSVEALLAQRIQNNHMLQDLVRLNTSLEKSLIDIEELGAKLSSSLAESVKAHRTKVQRIEQRIETKFKAHLKREQIDFINQFALLKAYLFPDGKLQERHDNFITLFKMVGSELIPTLLDNLEGFGNEFIVMRESKVEN